MFFESELDHSFKLLPSVGMSQNMLKISTEDRTPLVDALLEKLAQSDATIEALLNQVQSLKETIDLLKEEIARLKGTNKRPKIKPNKKDREGLGKNPADDAAKRPGSDKVSKKSSLKIHETVVITPDGLPKGSKLLRRRSFDVQDLVIRPHNTRYILEEWESPDGELFSAQMPSGISQGHFGNGLCAFILDQYHQCQVTQPLLYEQLSEFGIDISTGQINNILTEDKEQFHEEKDEILVAGLSVSAYIQTDDTGARHDGKTGYCTHIGNELFAWFQSSNSKSRLNFISILSSAYKGSYILNKDAFHYMKTEKMPQHQLGVLRSSIKKEFFTQDDWISWLAECHIIRPRHIKIASEAALFAGALKAGLNRNLVILSDDAGQFNISMLQHALCWIHEERHLKNLIAGSNELRVEALERALTDFWRLYGKLKDYKLVPTKQAVKVIDKEFDELFNRRTTFELLNQALKRIFAKKKELLLVLREPYLPLHNNASESDIREFVKRRKVSGGTRSPAGQRCRDTFASLKKTCRKLGITFYAFLCDRLSDKCKIDRLGAIIRKTALENSEISKTMVGGRSAAVV